jgi:HEAT repeat protein
VQRELNTILIRELDERQVVVLPLLFRDCQLPLFLKDKLYADFRGSYDEGFKRLLEHLCPPIRPEVIDRLMSEEDTRIVSAYSTIPVAHRSKYVDHLMSRLSSSSVAQRQAALYALRVLDCDQLPVALLAGLRDPSHSVRRQAVFLMGETQDSIYKRAISGLMSDGNPDVRQAARAAARKIDRRIRSVG